MIYKKIPLTCYKFLVPKNVFKIGRKRGEESNHSHVVIVPLLGLAVLLLDVLGHEESSVGELLDVGNVVVLGDVDSATRPRYEREATLYYPHPIQFPTKNKIRVSLSQY
ncbi:hypothetical protein PanWU01x14_182790 [Parasponia andersonii]|uniref:Uncharacterized protein n=1 Tax=Parasponia andersonii TaxID=3476 RepID=A0A2P5C5F5_PARAD|nr:hypothetical protein PanWU01x14_182790 [Parasponia andersonii]